MPGLAKKTALARQLALRAPDRSSILAANILTSQSERFIMARSHSKIPPRERREEARVELTRRATLLVGAQSTPCLLQNFSGRGFFIISNRQFEIGQMLDLRCELYPKRFMRCRVQVKHLNETCVGTRIVSISEEGQALLREFLQEYYWNKLDLRGAMG